MQERNPVRPGDSKKSRRKKTLPLAVKILIPVGIGIVGAIGAAAIWYTQEAKQYEQVFFDNTLINGVDASRMSVRQVEEAISAGIDGYSLTIRTRGGESEQITGEDMNLHSEFDGTLEKMLAEQKPNEWWQHRKETVTYQIDTMTVFDRDKLEEKLKALNCFDEARKQEPEDAYLSEYISGVGYQVVPETEGNVLLWDVVFEHVSNAVVNLQAEVDLESINAYKEAAVKSDDSLLNAEAEARNRIVNVTVTYRFGDSVEKLDGVVTSQWLVKNADGGIGIDGSQAAEYVKSLASRYNTAYKTKSLKTSYGPTVSISGGNYGWRINQTAETEALLEILRSGESQSREPVYAQTANSRGVNDYGNTYVEINLTAQHLYFYKDGKLMVESDFVSGNEAKGYSTPAGAYPLTYKQRNATLKGEDYATPVDYWMPFNGGIGMHDANWRSSFGGTIYKTNGSHGCVNLPPSVAKTIYENISSGAPVLCYHLSGTEKGSSSASSTPPAETQPAETQPAQTQPEETSADNSETTAGNQGQVTPVSPAETTAPETPPETKPQETERQTAAEPGADTTKGAAEEEHGPGAGRS